MRVDGDWRDAPGAQMLLAALEDRGHQALFVGGCVRNALLDVPVADVDIATSARPKEVMDIASDNGMRTHETGIDHGTVTLVAKGAAYEVTTFRRDVETDGRRAVVAFADTIEEDARRRDFTLNALYARRDGTLVDPLHGLPDLKARRIRFIDDPESRIREDFLRILRFFRFFAAYGDPREGIDPEGLAACARLSEGLETLSRERIGAEILRLLAVPDPAPAMAAMEQSGCLHRILPGATTEYLASLVYLEDGYAPEPIRRLATMSVQNAKTALRLSSRDETRLQTIIEWALADAPVTEITYRFGEDIARDAAFVRSALVNEPLPEMLEADISIARTAVFPIRAADLPHLSGSALGAKLKDLEDTWINARFSLTRAELLR